MNWIWAGLKYNSSKVMLRKLILCAYAVYTLKQFKMYFRTLSSYSVTIKKTYLYNSKLLILIGMAISVDPDQTAPSKAV